MNRYDPKGDDDDDDDYAADCTQVVNPIKLFKIISNYGQNYFTINPDHLANRKIMYSGLVKGPSSICYYCYTFTLLLLL